MKLTRIIATNFKGMSFDETLSPLTLFVGANFAGKTARTDAIRLLLLGYLPELGKNNKDTFSLSSGATMSVKGEFDNGLTASRTWTLKGDSVRLVEEVPDEIKNFGQMAVMLNASSYFGLSDRARVDYVFGLVQLDGVWTREGIMKRLGEKVPDALTQIEGMPMLTSLIERMQIHALNNDAPTIQAFVDAAIEQVASVVKLSNDYAKGMEATIQKLTALRAADLLTGKPLAVLQADKVTVQAEIDRLNQEKGGKMAQYTAMIAARQRREGIDRDLRFADTNRRDMADLMEKLSLIATDLAAMPTGLVEELHASHKNGVALNQTHADLIRLAEAADKAVAKAQASLDTLDSQKICPYCGASGEGWKILKKAEWLTEIEQQTGNAEQARGEAAKVDVLLGNARAEYTAIKAKIDRVDALKRTAADTQAKINALTPAVARIESLVEERARLPEDNAELDASVQAIQTQLNVHAQDLRQIEAGINAAQGRAQEARRLAEAEAQRDKAQSDHSTAKAVVEELRTIQKEMVCGAFKPLLDHANTFVASILKSPLAYNADGGEIGTWRNGVWVGHKTMSGTEKALVYAAIQAALSISSPCRIMLIDELARLDADNLSLLLNRVKSAVSANLIDQFVGISPALVGVDSAFQTTLIP